MITAIATDPAVEAQSQKSFGCAFDSLNENQQRMIALLIELPAHLEAMKQETRSCMTCGQVSSLQQCMACRDGQSNGYKPRLHSVV